MKETAAIAWIRTPRRFDFFRGWTIGEREIFHLINWATQYHKRKGKISVRTLAWFSGYSERHVYRILRRLKTRGAICALVTIGCTAVYYLRYEYCGPRTPTPDNQHVRGDHGVNNKEQIEKNRRPPWERKPAYVPYLVYGPKIERGPGGFTYEDYARSCTNPVPLLDWNPDDYTP
jgi:hypothetical protein